MTVCHDLLTLVTDCHSIIALLLFYNYNYSTYLIRIDFDNINVTKTLILLKLKLKAIKSLIQTKYKSCLII